MAPRCFLPSSRRLFEARVGRVARRGGGRRRRRLADHRDELFQRVGAIALLGAETLRGNDEVADCR